MNFVSQYTKPVKNKALIYSLITLLLFPIVLRAETIQLPTSGQTAVYAAGDDGAIQAGLQRPVSRYIDNNNGSVTDSLTGLVWLKNAACFGYNNWSNSLMLVKSLASGQCSLTDNSIAGDWRMANLLEMESLLDYSRSAPSLPTGHPFTNVQQIPYWTSTSYGAASSDQAPQYSNAYMVSVWSGEIYGMVLYGKSTIGHVWPVRGGQ